MLQMAWDHGYRSDNPVQGIRLKHPPAKPIVVATVDMQSVNKSTVEVTAEFHPEGFRFLTRNYTKNGEHRRFKIDHSVAVMVQEHIADNGIKPGQHAARFQGGSLGVLQGTRSYILQDEHGQIQATHSVSAGLDYAAVGPEHAWLRDQSRVEYGYATDEQALTAFIKLARLEGIIPALESSHAVAAVMERAPKLEADKLIIVNLSGRGDKDVAQVASRIKL